MIPVFKYSRLPKSVSVGNYLSGTMTFVQEDGAKKAVS